MQLSLVTVMMVGQMSFPLYLALSPRSGPGTKWPSATTSYGKPEAIIKKMQGMYWNQSQKCATWIRAAAANFFNILWKALSLKVISFTYLWNRTRSGCGFARGSLGGRLATTSPCCRTAPARMNPSGGGACLGRYAWPASDL